MPSIKKVLESRVLPAASATLFTVAFIVALAVARANENTKVHVRRVEKYMAPVLFAFMAATFNAFNVAGALTNVEGVNAKRPINWMRYGKQVVLFSFLFTGAVVVSSFIAGTLIEEADLPAAKPSVCDPAGEICEAERQAARAAGKAEGIAEGIAQVQAACAKAGHDAGCPKPNPDAPKTVNDLVF